jgi:hypothetical protein
MALASHVPVRLLAALILVAALVLAALPLGSRVAASQPTLLFSEYVDGTGNNKALEIHNLGQNASFTALNAWILIYEDGAADPTRFVRLDGFLPSGEVWVVAHPEAGEPVRDAADQVDPELRFDGNDAIVLMIDWVAEDRVGQVGDHPATGWGSGDTSTHANTLRRLESVTTGDPNLLAEFDPAQQWVGVGLDAFDGLGCWGESACSGDDPPGDDPPGDDPPGEDGSPLGGLRELVETFRDDGSLDPDAADALLRHLDRADTALAGEDDGAARGQLRAFAARLNGFEARDKVSAEAATALRAGATDALASLCRPARRSSCPPATARLAHALRVHPAMQTRDLAVAPLLLIFAVACATEDAPRTPVADPVHTDPVGAGGVAGEIPADLVEDVIRDASVQTGVPEQEITVIAVNEMDWQDGTLGCPEAFDDPEDPTVIARGGSVGWQVFLDADGQDLDYRVAEHRFFILCEDVG